MGLSTDLISQFVKATNDATTKKESTTAYGTVQIGSDGKIYVQLDGSETSTPVKTTVGVKNEDRVMVLIKNHTATITGNLTDPSLETTAVGTMNFNIEKLQADHVVIQKTLTASSADITNLKTKNAEITGKLDAHKADIDYLSANKLDVEAAEAEYATIENLDSTNATIHNLESTYGEFEKATVEELKSHSAYIADLTTAKLDAASAKVLYANIDFSNIGQAAIQQFFSKSGMISDLVVGDGTITGKLVGVTISGDLIEGNTVKAEKLVVKGSDGLYYKLNIEAGATTSSEVSESDLQNGLHGTAIIAKTITAEKISVRDLVAFGATIGGFNISEDSLYSGTKTSVGNTTKGIYLDSTGQMAIGDAGNFIKYYKDPSGAYKLEISASSILLGTSSKSVETAISEVRTAASKAQQTADNIAIGGRNLLLDTDFKGISQYYERIEGNFSEGGFRFYPTMQIESGVEYTLSACIRGNANVVFYEINTGGNISHQWIKRSALSETEYKHYSITFVVGNNRVFKEVYICTQYGDTNTPIGDWFEIKPKSLKLEKGNKFTDWAPAPEDVNTATEAAQTTADEANANAESAKALIAQLSDSISMLVTDGNGTSLMTQTEDGWTFSTADIKDMINRTSEGLNDLTNEVGDVGNAVDILQQAVNDLGVIAEYVKITTYEDEPCIELGEGDSEFKLRITNTRMIFTEGSSELAYFNNKSLHIKKAVVEEELQQGGFVWKARTNGNMGLVWKGGIS